LCGRGCEWGCLCSWVLVESARVLQPCGCSEVRGWVGLFGYGVFTKRLRGCQWQRAVP